MKQNSVLATVLAALVAAAAIGAVSALAGGAHATKSGRSVVLAKLSKSELRALAHTSAQGTPVTLPASDVRTDRLIAAGYRSVSLLSTRAGRSYFRLATTGQHDCFGVGQAGSAWPFGVISCRIAAPYFPSAQQPILDESVVGSDAGEAQMHFIHVQGFASDGIATINVLNDSGAVINSLPVVGNTYSSGSTALPTDAVAIEALDAGGNVLAKVPNG
jgi:hypothetical protein